MFRLPVHMSQEILSAFGDCLRQPASKEMTFEIALAVKKLFDCRSIYGFIEVETKKENKNIIPLCCFVSSEDTNVESDIFCSYWVDSGTHKEVSLTLKRRLSVVSYSAFSWTYPCNPEIGVPTNYSMLIPCSSELILHHDSEEEFFGYFVLFYDSFPALTESVVGFILSLPPLLSDIIAGRLRYVPMDRDININLKGCV